MESYVTAREKKVRTHAAVMEWSEMIQGEQVLSRRYTHSVAQVHRHACTHARHGISVAERRRDPLSFLEPDRMRASGPCWHDAARARGQGTGDSCCVCLMPAQMIDRDDDWGHMC